MVAGGTSQPAPRKLLQRLVLASPTARLAPVAGARRVSRLGNEARLHVKEETVVIPLVLAQLQKVSARVGAIVNVQVNSDVANGRLDQDRHAALQRLRLAGWEGTGGASETARQGSAVAGGARLDCFGRAFSGAALPGSLLQLASQGTPTHEHVEHEQMGNPGHALCCLRDLLRHKVSGATA